MKRSAKDTTIVAQVNAETAANVVYEDQLDFDKAIKYFSETEEKCDLLIQRQDDLIRHVSRRMHGSADKTGDADMLVQLSPNPGVRTSLNATDLPFSEYRKIAALAVDRVGKQMPMATMRFIAQAGNSEVDIIEDLEAEIIELRRMMRNIEEVIIEQTPRSARDATTKLKFMTGLMLDGGEIEVDLFAYVVAECAEVIEIDLQRLRK
jgi:hypothetical protein